jgi:ABC-type transporter Mla MlaB component
VEALVLRHEDNRAQMETVFWRTPAPNLIMDYYQHDGATTFRFQLAGELTGPGVTDLEHAWQTATSIMRDKQLVLDVSDLTGADAPGIQLLKRMLGSGARLVATEPPASPSLLQSLGAPVVFKPRPRPSRSLRGWIRGMFGR